MALLQEGQRPSHFLFRRHSRREQHRFAGRRDVLDERKIREVRRSDLVSREVAGFEKIDARAIPRRAHCRNLPRSAVIEQLAELVVAQLEFDQQRNDVLQSLLAVPRLVDDLFPVGFPEFALLELDRVRACVDRRIDELLRDVEIAVVIDADFGDHVAWLPRTDAAGPDVEDPFSLQHGPV